MNHEPELGHANDGGRAGEAESREVDRQQVLLAIRGVYRLLLTEDDPEQLIAGVCRQLTATSAFRTAWLALLDAQQGGVVATASAGLGAAADRLDTALRAGRYPAGMRQALDQADVVVVDDPAGECPDSPLADMERDSVVLSCRMRFGHRTFGILTVAVPGPRAVGAEDRQWLLELAGDLASALHKLEVARTLRESQADLQRAQELAQVGSWRIDLRSGLVEASAQTRRVYGMGDGPLTVAEIEAAPLAEHRAALDAEFSGLIERGEPYDIEFRIRRASDGAMRYIHSVAEYDAEQQAVIGTLQDIAARREAEEALRASEHRFRSFVENARDIVYAATPDGYFTYISPNWQDALGEPAGNAVGRHFAEYVHPEDVPICQQFLEQVLAGEEPSQAEYRVRHAAGGWRWHVSHGSALRDAAGLAVKYVGIARDVTESRQAAEELRRREAYLRTILQTTVDGFWVLDADGLLIDCNDASCHMLGWSRAERVGRPIAELDVTESAVDTATRLRRIAEQGAEVFETEMLRKDGRPLPVEVSSTWMPEESGGGRFVCFGRDLTDRRQREQRIDLLVQMLDVAPAAITIHDFEGRFLYANRTACAMHGYEADEFLKLDLQTIDGPTDAALIQERMRRIAADGEARFEVLHRRFDGSEFPLEVLAKVIDWSGRPVVLSVGADITERRRAESEQERLQAQLAQAQRLEAIGNLAGGVAHDFNNMLNVILGHAELALDDLPDETPVRADLEQIRHAAGRSAALTRQLLTFARRQTVAPKVLDLNETVESMLKMLRRLIGEDLELVWLPCPGQARIDIDPAQVDQLLANLVVNARHAIGRRGGTVTIQTCRAQLGPEQIDGHEGVEPGEFVQLTVTDDGCGIDAAAMEHLFEPFFTTKPVGEGTGLGLATVFGIVSQNRGLIEVESQPGAGASFRIAFPACPSDEPVAETGPAGPGASAMGHETILLVEDEPDILSLGVRMLRRQGYTVLAAATPQEGLRLAAERDGAIDLLITDVIMPVLNGRDLALQLQAAQPGLRCLYISGYTSDVIAEQGVIDAGLHFLQKPFTAAALAAKVRAVLDRD